MLLKLSKKVQMKNFKLMDAGTTQHMNKAPFTCSLFALDKPSDGSPQGAGGKLIRISSAVSDQFLSTFEGMGMNIDYEDGMYDHDTRFKVGVITKTFHSMDGMAMAEGYIFGKDFPDVIATIRYYNGLALENQWPEYQFGTSIEMEAKVTTAPDDANVLDVVEFCGTGAAILFADAAAYKSTSFAAKNQKPDPSKEEVVKTMTPEEIKAAMAAALEGFGTSITASFEKAVGEVKTEVGALKTELDQVKATKAAEDLKAAEEATKQAAELSAAELKAANEKAEKAEKDLADFKAAQELKDKDEPQRKTLSAAQLLSNYGGKVEEGQEADLTTVIASIDKLNLSSTDSMKLKMQARAELGKKESV